jgi:poly-gamma-glutamate capsule biosynthesis protein CapA/YwtB (metallophosphatase superfamily)
MPARSPRRQFLARAGGVLAGSLGANLSGALRSAAATGSGTAIDPSSHRAEILSTSSDITLFLCGDVMTGRGIDQILPHPGKPHIYEPYLRSALGYVEIAEQANGPIARPVDFAYIWGDALAEFERVHPAARIINLETAITASEDAWPGKGIHYRMHPANVSCLTAGGIDCCVLANNHTLDWGYRGLAETLDTLRRAVIRTAGAGRDEAEAAAPAVIPMPRGRRVLVFAFGTESAGVPRQWAAAAGRAGVNLLQDLSRRTADAVARRISAVRHESDIVIASIHWGGNWGFEVPREQRAFAHHLIDTASVDLVQGHSSHHPKAIEIYRDKAILYGCGDFLNDYEGIRGHQSYRPDLALMYWPTFNAASGRLARFALTPTQIRRFRVNRAPAEGARWLADTLNREGRQFNTRVEAENAAGLLLHWH